MLHSSRPLLVRARPFRQECFPALTINSRFPTKTPSSPKFTVVSEVDEEDDEVSQDPFVFPAEKVISTYFETHTRRQDSTENAEVAEPESPPALIPNSSFESASSLSSEGCTTPTDDGEDPFSDFSTWFASSEIRKAVLATTRHSKELPALPSFSPKIRSARQTKPIRNVRFAEEESELEHVKLFLKDDAPADLNLLDGEALFAKVRELEGVNLRRRNAIGKKAGRRYNGRFGDVQKELSPPPKFSIFEDDDDNSGDDVVIICD